MNARTGTVVVVDDDQSVRNSLKRLLRSAGHQVRTFSSVAHLSHTGRPPEPCCLVLDVDLPGETGLAFKRALDEAQVRIPTIFLTGIGDVAMGVGAMRAGAFHFLTKPVDADELLRTVAAAIESDIRQLEVERRFAALRDRFVTLTSRERDVFFAVTRGLLNKQVAMELGVSEKTVKVHRGRVTEKLAADSVAELVRMADRLQDQASSPVANHPVAAGYSVPVG